MNNPTIVDTVDTWAVFKHPGWWMIIWDYTKQHNEEI